MRSIFNHISLFSKKLSVLRSLFKTAQTGMDIEVAAASAAMLTEKLTHLHKTINREDHDVHISAARAAFLIGTFQRDAHPQKDPWMTMLDSLLYGIQLTRITLLEENNEGKLASLGRIEYQTQLFQSWYLSQDPRMKPVFQTLANLHDDNKLLLAFFPKGQHAVSINGQPYPFEIK